MCVETVHKGDCEKNCMNFKMYVPNQLPFSIHVLKALSMCACVCALLQENKSERTKTDCRKHKCFHFIHRLDI